MKKISNNDNSRGLTAKRSNRLLAGLTAIIMAVSTLVLSSCSLDTDNEKMMPAYASLKSLSDLRAAAANLYLSPWYEFHKRFIYLGDGRSNNLLFATTDYSEWSSIATFNEQMSTASVQRPWASLYTVITQAGYIIDDYCPYCVQQGICTQAQTDAVAAEARFMRALAYYFLGIYWHNVPIVDNATTVNTQARANRFEDVLLYAIRDAEFAATHLAATPYEIGRVSQTSARVLLSRLYLTLAAYAKGGHLSPDRKGFDIVFGSDATYQTNKDNLARFLYLKADETATDAIEAAAEGGYELMEDYEQIFRVQNNNCKEVLFAIQFVNHNTTTGLANDLGASLSYRYCLNNRYGKAWSTVSSYDFVNVAHYRGGLNRTRANIFMAGTTYDYLFHELDTIYSNDCKAENHEHGKPWTVESNLATCPLKKHVVGGPIATDGVAVYGNSGFCTPMLRLSEAYLNQTEARLMLAGGTASSDATVLSGINTVRQRAYRIEREKGIYPGDYTSVNLDTLLQERRMEFFAEGLFWGDIVRRSFMSSTDLKSMVDYMNNRLVDVTADPTVGCYRMYKYSYKKPDDVTASVGTPTLSTTCYRPARECTQSNLWAMIYPPSEVALDPNLSLEPIAYFE